MPTIVEQRVHVVHSSIVGIVGAGRMVDAACDVRQNIRSAAHPLPPICARLNSPTAGCTRDLRCRPTDAHMLQRAARDNSRCVMPNSGHEDSYCWLQQR